MMKRVFLLIGLLGLVGASSEKSLKLKFFGGHKDQFILKKGTRYYINESCEKVGENCVVFKKLQELKKSPQQFELYGGISPQGHLCKYLNGKFIVGTDEQRDQWGVCYFFSEFAVTSGVLEKINNEALVKKK